MSSCARLQIEVTPLGVRREFFGEVKAGPESKAGIVCEPGELGAQQGAVLARYRITSPFVLGVGTLEPRNKFEPSSGIRLAAFAVGKPVSTCVWQESPDGELQTWKDIC